MSLQHDPLSNLRLFRGCGHPTDERAAHQPARGRRAVDILETENELVVKADLPDVRAEDIDVRVENQTLSIKGERRFEEDDSAQGYHRIERSYGSFVAQLCRAKLRGHGESFGGL